MDLNATDILKHETFKTLSQDSLCGLLERDSFFAPEVTIFVAVEDWCKNNTDVNPEVILFYYDKLEGNLKPLIFAFFC